MEVVNKEQEIVNKDEPVTEQDTNIRDNILNSTEQEKEVIEKDFSIPEEYKDKKYLKDVKSLKDIYKKLDGAEQLLGRRPQGIPEVNAPQEEWEKFYSYIRPKETNGYKLDNIKNENYKNFLSNAFFESGLSIQQAEKLQKNIDNMFKPFLEEAKLKTEKEFSAILNKTYGNNVKQVETVARDMINKFSSKELKPMLTNLDNNSLMIMVDVLNNVYKEYINEDTVNMKATGSMQISAEQLREEARKLICIKEKMKVGSAERIELEDKIHKMYKEIAKG